MRTFQCDRCNTSVFFENFRCLGCNSTLGIDPRTYLAHAIESSEEGESVSEDQQTHRLCENSVQYGTCNQLVPAGSAAKYCLSCQFTEVTPDLRAESSRSLWAAMERAKRRMLYSLSRMGIEPVPKKIDPAGGLSFRFLAEDGKKIMTGHQNGLITITLAEADDAIREARRQEMGENYRTLLGHFRHEVGHYYWTLIIEQGDLLEDFRSLFGDESQDYGEALTDYYAKTVDDSWQVDFISRYATAHPWEDWAETFAHFLHMNDVLETAFYVGLIDKDPTGGRMEFGEMILLWVSTSYRLNQLGRSMGSGDLYPFVLTDAVIAKMGFISCAVEAHRLRKVRQSQAQGQHQQSQQSQQQQGLESW